MMSTKTSYINALLTSFVLVNIKSMFSELFQLIESNPTLQATWNASWNLSGQIVKRAGISETGVVRLIVAFLLFAILFPIAMAQITSATTTAWNPAVATVFSVLTPILVALAAALGFFAVVESRGNL